MYGQLSEISRTKAHLDELKNEDLYLQFFSQCRSSFENNVMEMVRELLQSISNNYSHMLDHMGSMFRSIDGYRKGLGNEKFYMEYEARRSGIDQKILGEAQTADVGGNDLISFGNRTKDAVKKIVRKLVRKRKLLAWVPLLVLLCLFTTTAVVRQERSKQTVESAEQVEKENDSVLKDVVIDYGKKAVKSASPGILQAVVSLILALLVSLGAMVIFVVLVIILLYMCYLKLLKLQCNHQVCKRCGEYLNTKLQQFEQNNSFSRKLDTVMHNAADDYDRQYMDVLNHLFSDTGYEEKHEPQDENAEWTALHEEWEQIKYR